MIPHRIAALFLLGLFSCLIARAQTPTQTVRGTVTDKMTQAALVGATIALKSTPMMGATTDAEGSFRIESVPVGRYDVRISYLGYEEVLVSQMLVGSGKEVILQVEMQESVAALSAVEVSAAESRKGEILNEMAVVSSRAFSTEETSRYAANNNDPARMAQSFAGVAAASDYSNGIVIRGNSPRGILWRLNGIEIPNPNHFSGGLGSTGGGISMLSNSMMSNSDFMTGAFPAEYGNALSGIFDIRLRKGNDEQREFGFQLGVLGMQAALEGPFSHRQKGSYLVNYRYSTLVLLNAMGFNLGDDVVVPRYQDLSWNLTFPTRKAGTFAFFGLGGYSKGVETADRDSSLWMTASDHFEGGESKFTGLTGVSWTFLMNNDKTWFRMTAALSGEDIRNWEDSLTNHYALNRIRSNRFDQQSARLAFQANHKFNAHHLLRAGVNSDGLGFYRDSKQPDPLTGEMTETTQALQAGMFQSYIQWQWRQNQVWTTHLGLHHTSVEMTNNHVLEPRFSVRAQVSPRLSLAYGLGLHSKMEPLPVYAANLEKPVPDAVFIYENGNSFLFSPVSSLRLTQALHHVLGAEWRFLPDFVLRGEVYHQWLFNVPVREDSLSLFSTLNISDFGDATNLSGLNNRGKGRNYGIEFTLEKYFSRRYYFLQTLSLFQSEYSLDKGPWYPTAYSQGHILNLLVGKEWMVGKADAHLFSLNGRMVWAGGNRYTPVDLERSRLEQREVLDLSKWMEGKLPDYLRVDIGFSYRFNQKKYALILSLDVQNVFNRQNIGAYRYDPLSETVVETRQLGWIPVINFRVEF